MNYTITRTVKQWKKVVTDLDLEKDNEIYKLKLTNGYFSDYVKLSVLTLIPIKLKRKYCFTK